MMRTYYQLTKPGIIYGNAFNAAGGFFLASRGHIQFSLLLAMLAGLSFIIASACVFNNYIDRGIDKFMKRTKKRALVMGIISGKQALVYATILGIIGTVILILYTNFLTTIIALLGFFFYVVVYGICKRRSVHGTIVGSISGAVPPVVGYVAVTNNFDVAALIIFLILVFWQIPHFYAIALYRTQEYASAGIPVLPVINGTQTTKIHMMLYIAAFIIATSLLSVFKFTGYIYLSVMIISGIFWLWFAMQGFKIKDTDRWARKMFFISLIIILVFCVMISVGPVLP